MDALVDKQLEAFESNLAEIDLRLRPRATATASYDVVNVASMIEREIAVPGGARARRRR